MKKLTVPVAKALAEQVRKRLDEQKQAELKKATTAYQSSKEYKAYLKAHQAWLKAEKEYLKISEDLKEFAKYGKVYADGFTYRRDGSPPELTFRYESKVVDTDDIKNMILVENYTSESGETAQQLIDRIVKQLS